MASRALAHCMRSVARASARLNHGNVLTRSACAPLASDQRALSVLSCGQRTRWTDLVRVSFLQMGVFVCGLLVLDYSVTYLCLSEERRENDLFVHVSHTLCIHNIHLLHLCDLQDFKPTTLLFIVEIATS